MTCSSGSSSGKGKREEKAYQFILDSRSVIPIFPSGFCVSVKSSKDDEENFILLRFIVVEREVGIPIVTLALTVDMAKELASVLNEAVKKVKNASETKSKDNVQSS